MGTWETSRSATSPPTLFSHSPILARPLLAEVSSSVRKRAPDEDAFGPIEACIALGQKIERCIVVEANLFERDHSRVVHVVAGRDVRDRLSVRSRMSRRRRKDASVGKAEAYQMMVGRHGRRRDRTHAARDT